MWQRMRQGQQSSARERFADSWPFCSTLVLRGDFNGYLLPSHSDNTPFLEKQWDINLASALGARVLVADNQSEGTVLP